MGKMSPPAKHAFAISKSYTQHPLLLDRSGVEYTKHHIVYGKHNGVAKYFIADVELTKAEALQLIKEYNMREVVRNQLGTIWETTPSLKSECLRLGLTYSADKRSY